MKADIKTHTLGIGEIFNQAWRLFREKFWSILDLLKIYFLVLIAGTFIAGRFSEPTDLSTSVILCLVLIGGFSGSLILLALPYLVEQTMLGQDVTWWEAVKFAFPKIPGLIATSLLVGFIGFILFLLMALLLAMFWVLFASLSESFAKVLLILNMIPGMILYVYIAFFVGVVALRDRSGLEALKYSKGLVDGNWWRIAGNWTLLFISLYVANLVLNLFARYLMNDFFDVFVYFATWYFVNIFYIFMIIVWFLNLDYLKHPAPVAMERGEPDTPLPQVKLVWSEEAGPTNPGTER